MEGVTISSSAECNVDIQSIYLGMCKIAERYQLLNVPATNYITLQGQTMDLVLSSIQKRDPQQNLIIKLLFLWFPSLTRGVENVGGWSSFWDLDSDVGDLLSRAGYTEED